MIDRTAKRIGGEGGFTLIELLMVLIILGILLMVAVPSYLGFKDRASKSAAQANVRTAIPAVEAFYADNNTYVGINNAANGTPPGLAFYDAGIAVAIDATQSSATSYCVYSNIGGFEFFKRGPAGAITQDLTPGATPCA